MICAKINKMDNNCKMTPKQKIQEKITSLEIRILEHQQSNGFDSVFDFILEDLDEIKIEIGNIKQ